VPRLESVASACFRIPLPFVLSDSTHGDITHFELVTARLRDSDGIEGLGYTYTIGTGFFAARVASPTNAPLPIRQYCCTADSPPILTPSPIVT